MKLLKDQFEVAAPTFTDDLMALLKKYELHDGKSRLTLNSNGFRIQVDGMRDDCPEECKFCEFITMPNGKQVFICTCTC